jgi:deoxyadenosine/deoxycytidine kinase
MQPESRDIVCDFAMLQDLAYAGLSTGGEGDLKIVQALYDRVLDRIGYPSIIVRLKCAPATQLERIHRRGRSAERAIEQGYLVRLGDKIDENLARLTQQRDIPVVDIDTDRCDFVGNPETLAISSRLGALVERVKNT